MKDQELEVKFYISNLPALEARLHRLEARLIAPRTHETNLRFDTPDDELGRGERVLRLRQDETAHVTYKGPSEELGGARLRKEIEFTVGDFESARNLFEALGYQVRLVYEKYRATYELGGALVTLDELPYGNFTEIEGQDADRICLTAQQLGLDWTARLLESYTVLFEHLRSTLGFTFRDLTFSNFVGLAVTHEVLGARPADG